MTTTNNSAARECPILFSAPMVRAILDGTKTQTRRVLKPQPKLIPPRSWAGCAGKHWWACDAVRSMVEIEDELQGTDKSMAWCLNPYGKPGDRLWVRETWAEHPDFPGARRAVYRADAGSEYDVERWRPSIHMPRWACRILLEVTGVRVERLQAISETDARAEGIVPHEVRQMWLYGADAVERASIYRRAAVDPFRELWESIRGAGSWDANPWVWVVEFKRVDNSAGRGEG